MSKSKELALLKTLDKMAFAEEEDETPTTHAIASYCVWLALADHSDKKGKVKFPKAEEDSEIARHVLINHWSNIVLMANKPIPKEHREVFMGLAKSFGLSAPEMKGLMNLVNDDFGVMDMRVISMNGPIYPLRK